MKLVLHLRGTPVEIDIEAAGDERAVTVDGGAHRLRPLAGTAGAGAARVDGRPVRFLFERTRERIRIAVGGESYDFDLAGAPSGRRGGTAAGDPETRAPMPGKVLQVSVAVGAEVRPGDPLLVLEAMKMENQLAAEIEGTVAAVHVRPGEMVDVGKLLVVVSPRQATK